MAQKGGYTLLNAQLCFVVFCHDCDEINFFCFISGITWMTVLEQIFLWGTLLKPSAVLVFSFLRGNLGYVHVLISRLLKFRCEMIDVQTWYLWLLVKNSSIYIWTWLFRTWLSQNSLLSQTCIIFLSLSLSFHVSLVLWISQAAYFSFYFNVLVKDTCK